MSNLSLEEKLKILKQKQKIQIPPNIPLWELPSGFANYAKKSSWQKCSGNGRKPQLIDDREHEDFAFAKTNV